MMIIIKFVLCNYRARSLHVETEEGNSNFKLHQSCLLCMSQLLDLLILTIMWLLQVKTTLIRQWRVLVNNQSRQFAVSQVRPTSGSFMKNTTDKLQADRR